MQSFNHLWCKMAAFYVSTKKQYQNISKYKNDYHAPVSPEYLKPIILSAITTKANSCILLHELRLQSRREGATGRQRFL